MSKQKDEGGAETGISITVVDAGERRRKAQAAAEKAAKDVEAVAKAEKELTQLPKLPKELSQKKLSGLQGSLIDVQRRTIESLLVVLREKDLFLREWQSWVTSIRECSESVREAEKLLRNIDNRRVVELEKALGVAQSEVDVLKEEVAQLRTRVQHLLGK